ncbi:protein LURP-one-related 8-like [Cynara cardunculus var. scolymus]|uniref:LURP1-like domain-containing protein n=1 Tax=Cynara cardunculus var. scolymus TaxID=59895 RepID=A0A103Y649_CYNCS|nr:protein LURP-one-related 8-like [Cynara cardunculus var. scolymus]KVI03231.1 LURP1-like domain-containing protein [Cynara cardunculus var. scolymus]
MTKVHPNAVVSHNHRQPLSHGHTLLPLIVWKKSLLFNCYGFTVFDSNGNLVFRVDNYSSGIKDQILLMDASGHSLLTIRRKRLSLLDNWLVYEGETAVNPRFTVTKRVNLINTKSLAHVTATGSRTKRPMYEIEGSYTQRSCVVYDDKRRRVAEIKRKEAVGGVAFGGDVFRLFLHDSQMDPAVAMAMVIILDQMFL